MKVFLVDDEYLQRELVKRSVDWAKLDMEICGEAEDGEEALEKIFAEKPDILIMDINIPYMNGIEVSKKVKQEFPEMQIIILTAYGEFEYAKEAVAFGAVSFVLKPLNPSELTNELLKCREKVQKIHQQMLSVQKMQKEITQNQKDKFLLEQASGLAVYEETGEIWKQLGIPTERRVVVLLIRFCRTDKEKRAVEIEEIIEDYFPEYEMVVVNQGYMFILFGEETMEYKIQMLCTYLQEAMNKKRTWNGGISKVHRNIQELKNAYQEAYYAAQTGKSDNRLVVYEPVDIVNLLQTLEYDPAIFLYYLRKNEYEMFYDEVENIFVQMEKENSNPYLSHYVAMDLFVHICFFMSEIGIDFSTVAQKEQQELTSLQNNGSIREIRNVVMEILEKCFSCSKANKIPVTKRKVRDAVEFIENNFYRKDMSLNLVAAEIGVNASYLSNIFKKEEGCSLSKYLTQVRLEQAKRYLTEYPNKTLIDISEAVGYSDVYYFSKNFKKSYGISPSRYMEERKK